MNISFEELNANEANLKFSYLCQKLKEIIDLENFNLDTLKSLNLYNSKFGYNNAAKLLSDENDFPGVDIANVFRRLNIIEAFATGIKRINEAYKNAYVKPTYNVTPSAISITLPVIEDYSLSLNEAKVIDSIKDNYLYSRTDIEKLSGFTKDKLIRLLASLQEKGLIEKSGKGRATYYKKK